MVRCPGEVCHDVSVCHDEVSVRACVRVCHDEVCVMERCVVVSCAMVSEVCHGEVIGCLLDSS